MIFIADERSLHNIAYKLTGNDSLAVDIARINNIQTEFNRTGLVQIGQPISIPDNMLSISGKNYLISKGYSANIPDSGVDITLPVTTVTAKRDYTLYIVGAAVLVGLFYYANRGNDLENELELD